MAAAMKFAIPVHMRPQTRPRGPNAKGFPGRAGHLSFSTSVENGSTPGMSHFVHISSIFAWK
jgi:hypothetical protein